MKTTTHMLLYLLVIHLGLVQGWAQSERPNILFILSDDQAPWALGASGNADAHTPNLDELAKQGAYLVNAYVTTPVCSPSRASIMTSRYASELAILDFIPHPGHRLYDPDYAPGLAPESITFAEILQQAGYTTGLVGKWHLGDWTRDESNIYHPTKHGFSQFMGLTGGGTSAVDPTLEKDGISQAFKGLTSDILADQAIDFIEKNLASPFLLCYHTRAPHAPWLPVSEADWENFRDMTPILPNPQYPDLNLPKLREELRQYYASVSALDRNVGRVMDALVKNGLMENTIVIFFSDHGYNFGHHGIKHKGNGIWMTYHLPAPTPNIQAKYRPNLYENSLKVPAMVVWPPVVKKGLRI
ncbi:MAG: sulfatase-like hydrolase/transferase, partial [Bacteroidota bacterium]